MLTQPCDIFLMRCSINNHEVTLRGFYAVHKNIVDYATGGQQKMAIHAEPLFYCAAEVSRHHVLNEIKGPSSFNQKLAHVRNIKNPSSLAYRLMLFNNAGVLYRQHPAMKIDHACSRLDVPFVQGGVLNRSGG